MPTPTSPSPPPTSPVPKDTIKEHQPTTSISRVNHRNKKYQYQRKHSPTTAPRTKGGEAKHTPNDAKKQGKKEKWRDEIAKEEERRIVEEKERKEKMKRISVTNEERHDGEPHHPVDLGTATLPPQWPPAPEEEKKLNNQGESNLLCWWLYPNFQWTKEKRLYEGMGELVYGCIWECGGGEEDGNNSKVKQKGGEKVKSDDNIEDVGKNTTGGVGLEVWGSGFGAEDKWYLGGFGFV
ncbi:hypothetical protein EV426DRAFT_702159 [Tirmania nivea]|nr:hypothetical protein EV426DRAFT_702159 [Tirmania nivea]